MNQKQDNQSRIDAESIWRAGIEAVDGATLVQDAVVVDHESIQFRGINNASPVTVLLNSFDRIMVVGAGKASHCMAEGLETALGSQVANDKSLKGQVNIPDDQKFKLQFINAVGCRETGVNLPTPRVLVETENLLQLVESCDHRTLCIYLNSGGGSALLEKSPLGLNQIVAATNWLSSHGATIDELNTVRAALSEVKGGGLARAMKSGRMISLTIADVMSGDLQHVSSGPTFAREGDRTALALGVLQKLNAINDSGFPIDVIAYLETAKLDSSIPKNIDNVLIGDNSVAVDAAKQKAIELGYKIADAAALDSAPDSPALGRTAAQIVNGNHEPKTCFVSGGEPTMQLCDSPGQGGRNQHAVLVALYELKSNQTDTSPFCFLSAGSDGEDGSTRVAGAAVTHHDLQNAQLDSIKIADAIRSCDSYSVLKDQAIHGSMRTNVCDLRVLVCG